MLNLGNPAFRQVSDTYNLGENTPVNQDKFINTIPSERRLVKKLTIVSLRYQFYCIFINSMANIGKSEYNVFRGYCNKNENEKN